MLSSDLINKIRHIEIRTKRLVNDSFAGEYHSVFKGRGMEFEEVRPYQPYTRSPAVMTPQYL